MRYSFVLVVLVSLRCWSQTTTTGQATSNQPCSIANTGSGNKINITNCNQTLFTVPQLIQSISELGAKTTIVVSSDNVGTPLSQESPQFTGFLVQPSGFAVTCITASQPPPIAEPHVMTAVLIPPLLGNHIRTWGGVVNRQAAVLSRDGVAVLYVPGIIDTWASTSGLDSDKGKMQTREEHVIPKLASDLPMVGDQLFMVGVESGYGPRLTTVGGSVASVGSGPFQGVRIFAKLSFKPSYCGAPLFNEKKEVVGMVERASGAVDGEVEVIPAFYIRMAMKEFWPLMITIH